jgi:hypothetical protein
MGKTLYLVVSLILVFATSVYAQREDNLVALYLFDDESGDEVMDSSGNENHGLIRGDVKRVDGKFEGGLEFNGKDAFVEIPDSESLTITDGMTIAMWLYINSYSTAGGTGFTKETTYKAGTRSDKKMMIRATTAGAAWADNVAAGESDVPLDEWHHVAATYDANTGDAIIYLDGIEDGKGEFSGEIVPNVNPVWIGRGQNPYYDGIYDEVALWNVALSRSEILQVMNLLHFVEPAQKLITVWGRIKMAH